MFKFISIITATLLIHFSTFFIEYQFPVVATSRDKYSPNAMATEVMRVVSRNVKNNGELKSEAFKITVMNSYK